MQRDEQIKWLNARSALAKEWGAKKARYDEVYLSASQASQSSGSGSRSYTNHSLAEMKAELDRIAAQIRECNRMLSGRPRNGGITHVETVRC